MEQYLARFAWQGRFSRLFEPDALARGELVLQPLTLEYLSGGDDRGPAGIDGVRRGGGPPGRPAHRAGGGCAAAGPHDGGAPALRTSPVRRGGQRQAVPDQAPAGAAPAARRVPRIWCHRRARAGEAALAACLLDAYLCFYHLDRENEAGDRIAAPQQLVDALCAMETAGNACSCCRACRCGRGCSG